MCLPQEMMHIQELLILLSRRLQKRYRKLLLGIRSIYEAERIVILQRYQSVRVVQQVYLFVMAYPGEKPILIFLLSAGRANQWPSTQIKLLAF